MLKNRSDNPPAPEPKTEQARPVVAPKSETPKRSAYKPVRGELAPYPLEYSLNKDATPARLEMCFKQHFDPQGQPLNNPYLAVRNTWNPDDEKEVAKLQLEMEVELMGQLGAQLSQPIAQQVQVPETKSGEGAIPSS